MRICGGSAKTDAQSDGRLSQHAADRSLHPMLAACRERRGVPRRSDTPPYAQTSGEPYAFKVGQDLAGDSERRHALTLWAKTLDARKHARRAHGKPRPKSRT